MKSKKQQAEIEDLFDPIITALNVSWGLEISIIKTNGQNLVLEVQEIRNFNQEDDLTMDLSELLIPELVQHASKKHNIDLNKIDVVMDFILSGDSEGKFVLEHLSILVFNEEDEEVDLAKKDKAFAKMLGPEISRLILELLPKSEKSFNYTANFENEFLDVQVISDKRNIFIGN